MIIPEEEMLEEIDTSSIENIPNYVNNVANSKSHEIPQEETTKSEGDRRRGDVYFWAGVATVFFIAIASNIISRNVDPTITPLVSVYSSTQSLTFNHPFRNAIAYARWMIAGSDTEAPPSPIAGARWVICFSLTNPSPADHVLDYSNLVVVVYRKDKRLWMTKIPGFRQGGGGQDFVNAAFVSDLLKDVGANYCDSSRITVRILGSFSIGQKKSGRWYDRSMDVICIESPGGIVCKVSVVEN